MKIAVAGTGYVGLSIATLLAQHNEVTAVDIVPEKVDLINHRQSPIQDEYIEKYLAEKPLDLTASLDGRTAYVRSFDGIGVLVVTDKSGKGVEDVFTFVPKRGLKKRGLPPEQTPEGTH